VSKVLAETPISEGNKIYFQERLKSRLHEVLVNTFRAAEANGSITKTELARKLGKRPEQISRWLGSSSNMQLNTLSDMLLGLGYEPDISVRELCNETSKPTDAVFAYMENSKTSAVVSSLIVYQHQNKRADAPTTAATFANPSNTYFQREQANA
jgi:transcriptional regulator with XRE-family HTH domain